jgi:hypothetical protein
MVMAMIDITMSIMAITIFLKVIAKPLPSKLRVNVQPLFFFLPPLLPCFQIVPKVTS